MDRLQPNIIQTFSPDTHGNDLRRYTAILGDSHAQGGGDAYLADVYDYSIAHHLHRSDGGNYLIFGRGGFGSISAVSNLIKIYKASRYLNALENLGKPERIILCFYEGNDLSNNLVEYELNGRPDESIDVYVARRITENTTFSLADRIEATLPAARFLYNVFQGGYQLGLGKYRAVRDSRQPNPNVPVPDNSSVSGPIRLAGIEPLQSAAMELSEQELGFALQVFTESVRKLQAWVPNAQITIVYLPSVATLYQWQDTVRIQQYFPERGISSTTLQANNVRSALLRGRIAAFATQHGLELVDTTSAITEMAQRQVLHGPVDWKHLNDAGYRAIAGLLAAPRAAN